jgi:hypothetical protein
MEPATVLYIGGTGRSGSTVLANVLGELPGCVSVGELRYVWERGMQQDRLCGCGEPFGTCPFWRAVVERAFGDAPVDAERLRRIQHRNTRLRDLPRLIAGRSRGDRPSADLGDLPDALARLYAATLEVSGARVVVDSSKLPSYASLLDSLPSVDVRMLHLVRDPRAAAFSWRRRKEQPDRKVPGFMERRGAFKSVLLWVVWNAGLAMLWRRAPERYLRVGYEDFVANPAGVVDRVARMLETGYDPAELFPAAGAARLSVSHTVAGNPARLQHGQIRLTLDDEWRRAMPRRDRLVVSLVAMPLMRRYGYR